MKNVFTPFGKLTETQRRVSIIFWLVAGALFWQYWPGVLIPRPLPTLQKIVQFYENGLLVELWVSTSVILRAGFLLAFPIGCLLSYLYTIPAFKPPIVFFATLRNMSMTALVAAFLMMSLGGDRLKVITMAFVICVYFVSSVIQHFDEVAQAEIDHGATMRMANWQILWHRVIRQRFYVVCYDFVPCIAMGWAMLSFVEGLSRSEGGLGDLMLQVDKINSYAGLLALAIVSVTVGFAIWYTLRFIIRTTFRWATQMGIE